MSGEIRCNSRMRRRCILVLMAIAARPDSRLHHQHHVEALSSSHRQRPRTSRSSFAVGSARRKRAASDTSKHRPGPFDSDAERTVVLLYHKPKHVVTSHNADNDPLGRPTVYDDVRSMAGFVGMASNRTRTALLCASSPSASFPPATVRRPPASEFHVLTKIRPATKLHAVGRLDADTTGLLLLTNDGGLVHHVTHSSKDEEADEGVKKSGIGSASDVIDKTYEAVIMGRHEENSPVLAAVRNGVDLGPKWGGLTRPPVSLRVLDHPSRTTTLVEITILEGKNRQIRRMFHAAGSGVMQLKRVRIGHHLTLEGLEEEGSWRILSEDEVRDKLRWAPRYLN